MEEKARAVASPAPEVRRLKLVEGASTEGTGGARGSDDGAMAKFGISKNVRKANCFCARAALEQESGQATASEFELDLHTTSTRKHQKQSYG